MSPSLKVHDPGLFATVQDLGRRGCLKFGIPNGGALDNISLRLANLAVGNAAGEGAIEFLYSGPTLEVQADSIRVACVSEAARFEIFTPDAGMWECAEVGKSLVLTRGSQIRCRTLPGSLSAYIAIEGGFAIEPIFGSKSTFARGRLGGLNGRSLRAGDMLPLNRGHVMCQRERVSPLPANDPRPLRVLTGPQVDYFNRPEIERFFAAEYMAVEVDRMALRLSGPTIAPLRDYNIVSDGTAQGAIQIAGDGLPIVLSADRQTTGGYPKIGVVIAADLQRLGRLGRGARIRFVEVTHDEAVAARLLWAAQVARLHEQISDETSPMSLLAALAGVNLISGVVSASEFTYA
jgi:biotin-dependent carboxylase-like uncharacterized protein